MPGSSKKTVVRSVRLQPVGVEALELVAEKLGFTGRGREADAHKAALAAGCRDILGPMKWATLETKHRQRAEREASDE